MIRSWLVAVSLSLHILPCSAQEDPSVRAEADRNELSVGDRITLTVEVEHALDQTVGWPDLGDTMGSFEVVGANVVSPVVAEGRQTSTMLYELTTFELGELEIPAIEVAVSDTAGIATQTLATDPISVNVESVGIDETGDIRNVKAPLEIPRNWLLVLPWLLLIGALAGLAYWLYRRYRTRERPTGAHGVPRVPQRPPHEVALEALDRLEAKRLVERGETKQYFIEVSEIVRTYLEGRYPIDALEMTSDEVLRELKRVGLEPEVFDLFPPFFRRADLVKFAKYRPAPEVSNEMIPMARVLIDETRVRDRQEEPEAQDDGAELMGQQERLKVG